MESGVLDKGDTQKVQGRGSSRTGLESTVLNHLISAQKSHLIQNKNKYRMTMSGALHSKLKACLMVILFIYLSFHPLVSFLLKRHYITLWSEYFTSINKFK